MVKLDWTVLFVSFLEIFRDLSEEACWLDVYEIEKVGITSHWPSLKSEYIL